MKILAQCYPMALSILSVPEGNRVAVPSTESTSPSPGGLLSQVSGASTVPAPVMSGPSLGVYVSSRFGGVAGAGATL